MRANLRIICLGKVIIQYDLASCQQDINSSSPLSWIWYISYNNAKRCISKEEFIQGERSNNLEWLLCELTKEHEHKVHMVIDSLEFGKWLTRSLNQIKPYTLISMLQIDRISTLWLIWVYGTHTKGYRFQIKILGNKKEQYMWWSYRGKKT